MINCKKLFAMGIMFCLSGEVMAQFPIPSPRKAARHSRTVAREANNVSETVTDINDAVRSISDAKKTIDSLVAKDKSKTAGEIHLLFVGVQLTDETLIQIEECLKKIEGITNVKKVAKSGSIAIQMTSDLFPLNIWKKMPKSVQKAYFIHDKDELNIVLLYKLPPPKPSK